MGIHCSDLLSTQDTTSLITPALGFETERAAKTHLDKCRLATIRTAQLIQPEMGRQRHYVTIPGQWNNATGTGLLQHRIRATQGKEPVAWHQVCDKEERGEHNAYLVSLLSGGRRQYIRKHRAQDAAEMQLPDSFNNGPRDCYAVWSKRNTGPLEPIFMINQDEQGNFTTAKRLYSSKAAHGAVYAATEVYAADGSVAGIEMRLVLIQMQIMDRDPKRDDKLRVQIIARTHVHPKRVKSNPRPDLSRVPRDSGWINLVNQAYEGFLYECSPKAR